MGDIGTGSHSIVIASFLTPSFSKRADTVCLSRSFRTCGAED